ncbi:oligogalacturonate lyase family protein [Lacrimispora sp.]|uniref:oligogalacturonate lyase family protein n=1 Tax=Lacrimispora sp. TaxID=2719234 RepID=UPI0028A78738|nr:oligogalacturonate lyase family protein [Lacrimispora sp.]
MKGDTYVFNRTSFRDPLTGVELIRLTDNKAIYDRPYFTTTQFTRDGRYTIFVSDFTKTSVVKNPNAPAIGKVGFGELFLLELETGKALQLTQGEAVKMGHGAHGMIAPDGKTVYYYSNEELKETDVRTLESKVLMHIPNTYNFHSLSMTDDCRYVAFSLVEELPLLTAGFSAPLSEAAPGARERFFKRPGSLVLRYDRKKKSCEAIYGGHERITHVGLAPGEGDRLLFCNDGPWHLVQRMWTVDALTDEVKPLFLQQKYLEQIGHEFFTPSGRIGAQYSFRYRADMPFFQHADIFMDFDGKNQERFYYPYDRPGHISVAVNERQGIGDTCMLSENQPDSRRYLSLIHYDSQGHRAEPYLLCAHDTSGKKSAHVHPVFTPDGSHILFSSDKEGLLNIYMVEADWSKARRTI